MNLDAMPANNLWALFNRLSHRLIKEARKLFPEKPQGYVGAARTLKRYAASKATAMSLRATGNIAAALRYEAICERLYKELPDFARC